ncbi:MAG: uracil-DNA glycosylase family protein [Clostridium sp.]|nr:uracil-DNA glycosylase family protein [Clostridium sp.]
MADSTSTFLRHPIPPLYDENSRILILGSFPSPKSREAQFFYGHPQNRFWKVMAQLLNWQGKPAAGEGPQGFRGSAAGEGPQSFRVPSTVEEKRAMLLSNHVAVWDTIASCEIVGASDASITNVTPNDLSPILRTAEIRAIFCNGAASHKLYMKYIFPRTGREAGKLPSTSPANAAWSVDRLSAAWQVILPYLK